MIDYRGSRCVVCDDTLPADTDDPRVPRAVSRLRLVCPDCYALVIDSEEEPGETETSITSLLRRAFADEPEQPGDALGWGATGRKAWLSEHAERFDFYPEQDVHLVRIFEVDDMDDTAVIIDGRPRAVFTSAREHRDIFATGAIEEAMDLEEGAVEVWKTTKRDIVVEIADEDTMFDRQAPHDFGEAGFGYDPDASVGTYFEQTMNRE